MAPAESTTLRPETATAYLERRGVFDQSEVTAASADALGGGVSNRVVRVVSRDRCLVLKQPLSNLAVDDDWPADVSRVHNEAAAARAYAAVAHEIDAGRPEMSTTLSVPEVVFEDEPNHVLAMECAPSGTKTWKEELLAGTVDLAISRTLGSFLGVSHRSVADRVEIKEQFRDPTPFRQLRIEPYHRTTAARNPALADAIDAEAERVLGVRKTLVHGDYSPKNVLVDRSGTGDTADSRDATGSGITPIDAIPDSGTGSERGSIASAETSPEAAPTLWLIDFEVAHWGDPAFDTGFMLNHLFIKSVHNDEFQDDYLDAARAFWRAYDDATTWNIEAHTVRELAVLMLARVDGKSPVEYIDDRTGEMLHEISRRALVDEIETIEGYVSLTQEVSA